MHSRPVRVQLPAGLMPLQPARPLQSLAEQPAWTSQH